MAKICKNAAELEKELMKKINGSLIQDVAPVVENTMIYSIEKNVYDAYEPSAYSRRQEEGGLIDRDNIVSKVIDNGVIAVTNETLGEETYVYNGREFQSKNAGKPIAGIIESGKGYDYWKKAFPRPFLEETVEMLNKENVVSKVLRDSLKLDGLEVK